MKLKLLVLPVIIAGTMLLFSSSINAIGLGLYGTASKGTADWSFENQNSNSEWDESSDISKIGYGFTLDTALAIDRLFNYRLHVGYTKIKLAFEDNWDVKGTDYHLYNSFGFGVFRSQPARIWLGPQIGFGVIDAEYETSSDPDYNSFVTIWGSLGIIAGINFNIGDIVTLALDGGYRVSWHGGEFEIGNEGSEQYYNVTGKEKEAFVDIAVMLRINDIF